MPGHGRLRSWGAQTPPGPSPCPRASASIMPATAASHGGGWEGELLRKRGAGPHRHPGALAGTQPVPPAPPQITGLINKLGPC